MSVSGQKPWSIVRRCAHTCNAILLYGLFHAAGALCQYKETERSRELLRDCGSYDEYTSALVRECNSGQPATLVFTPDETTPDTVYYQVYNMHATVFDQ